MLESFKFIGNIGRFREVRSNERLALDRLTLIYSENGRGKTTLCAVLRSLSMGDSSPILERRRLSAAEPSRAVIEFDGMVSKFDGTSWTDPGPRILVFDEHFVNANVYSGVSIDASHRQNLHEIILGEDGVKYLRRVQELKQEVESAHKEVREKERLIPESVRGGLSADDFAALPLLEDLDALIAEAESSVRVLENARAVREAADFEEIALPAFDADDLNALLGSNLAEVDQAALDALRVHFAVLGDGAEEWVAAGVDYAGDHPDCPFCGQGLEGSSLLTHYRGYFSEAYREHCEVIGSEKESTARRFSGDRLASVQRALDKTQQAAHFWRAHVELPEFTFETEALDLAWREARDQVTALLDRKAAAPLDAIELDTAAKSAIESLSVRTTEVTQIVERLVAVNPQLAAAREHAGQGSLSTAQARLAALLATKRRYEAEIDEACRNYLEAKTRKETLEVSKEQAREALDEHRDRVFGDYQAAISRYLDLFHADFAIVKLEKSDAAGIPSTTYSVVVNTQEVPLSPPKEPAPSFETALSSGDRNTLALAFFFAQLQQDSSLSEAIVVIDDPMTSLDAGRSHTTTQEVRKLLGRTRQLVVLSHSRDLLLSIWEKRPEDATATLAVRDAAVPDESVLEPWDAEADAITDFDRSFKLVNDFAQQKGGKASDVATELRIFLEQFLRVAFVEHMPPGRMLGQFLDKARQLRDDGTRSVPKLDRHDS